jgi:drug/metabolite transporter (DMT)-like permease
MREPAALSSARLLVLAAALLFSTGGTAIKATTLSAWQVAGLRSGVAASLLLLLAPQWRPRAEPRALLVGVAYASVMILFVMANKLTTAANTIFLQSTAPIYVLLLGPWLLRERVRAADLAYVAVAGVGIVLLVLGGDVPQRTAPDPMRGNVLAAASAVSWALTVMGLRWLAAGPGDTARLQGTALVTGNLITCAVCLPVAEAPGGAAGLDWALVGYLGAFQIGLAYVCLARGVRGVSAMEASLLLLVEPVCSALWAWALLAERPGPRSLAGCALVLAATAWRTTRVHPAGASSRAP